MLVRAVWEGASKGERDRGATIDAVDKVGEEVVDVVKWTGLRATGGAAFLIEVVVEVERRWSTRVDSFLGTLASGAPSCKDDWEKFLLNSDTADFADVGLVSPFSEFETGRRGFGGGGGSDTAFRSLELMLGTVTQSGSSVSSYGFEGRWGFGIKPFCGGWIFDLAGWLLSSHHFRVSELAGGSPGSIGS